MQIRDYFFKADAPANGELVCYVVGFTAKVSQFKYAINKLQERGYDVIAFDYDTDVMLDGDPQNLVDVVNEVTRLTKLRVDNYKGVVCMGSSLGACIAFNVQRRIPKAYVGAYATAGVSISESIFWMKAFKSIKVAFRKNNITQEKLSQAWKDIEIKSDDHLLNNKSLVIVNGMIDSIVDHRAASEQLKNWKKEGVNAKLYKKPLHGHTTTVLWYLRNTNKILDKALSNHAESIAQSVKNN